MMKISLWLSFLWILLLGNDFIQAGSPAGQWGQADISKHSRVSFVVRAKPQTENGLRRGHPVESNLAGGQAHKYLFTASANQFVRIVVVQQSLNVTVRLLDENGKSLAEVNSPKFKADPNKSYGHPYYWAPFILIGNWK
ncbi:MAG: hypothetical protein JST84_11250 [Acidobacteria bacterium]|nr:hypothetical protein [Acidobacteriota bacterium]